MTTEEKNVIVFKDQAGDYFLLPQAMLERGRVPAENRAEVERLIAAQGGTDGDDVQGHLFWIAVAMVVAGGSMAAYGVATWPDGRAYPWEEKGTLGPGLHR